MPETATECVMTLAEAAAFLRVSEDALAEQAEAGEVPGRKIGAEWRFLQRALVEWLYGRELANGAVRAKPGSKEAVRKVIGILRDHDDLEATLADLAEQRAAWPKGSDS